MSGSLGVPVTSTPDVVAMVRNGTWLPVSPFVIRRLQAGAAGSGFWYCVFDVHGVRVFESRRRRDAAAWVDAFCLGDTDPGVGGV